MDENFIKERIAQLRTQQGISARELSLTLGQSTGYINTIENGKSLPSMSMFLVICDFFKISPKDFFDDGVENPEKLSNLITDLKTLNEEQLAIVKSVVKGLKK